MKKTMERQSLYRLLLTRTLLFLIVPFLLVITLLFIRVKEEGERNYRQKQSMMLNQVLLARQTCIDTAQKIGTRIAANETLKGFFLVPYSSDNLFYYSSVIQNLLSPESGEEGIYSSDVYYKNTTIPAGFGRFHRLDKMVPESVEEFASSSETCRWVIPRDGYSQPYLYMQKVFAGEELVYILTVSVEAKAMNGFLFLSSQDGPSVQWKEDEDWLVVNYSRYALDDLLEAGQPLFYRRVVRTTAELRDFPQSVLVITDANLQKYWIYAVFSLVILLMLVLMGNEVGIIREIFARIQSCMKGFEASVEGGFAQKLEIHGNNEISRIEEAFNVQIDKIQELLELTKKQVELVKDSQLIALQHQINPHFLYNTLETFSYLMERHGHYEEADAIVAFSRMMRYNTMKNSSGCATIGQELAQVNNYLSIQKLKNQKLHVQVEISEELYHDEILRFLLQPLIENCVQHGYCGRDLHILLKGKREGEYLHFEVYDDGCGISPERVKEINRSLREKKDRDKIGIGLSNINDRLCLFYSRECGLQVESKEGEWTRIRFLLPGKPSCPAGRSAVTDERRLL